MLALRLHGEWVPRKDYVPTPEEERTKKAHHGSRVWKNTTVKLEDIERPKPGPGEVLLRIRACGICGSDIHMYEKDEEGYMLYPGLVGPLPVVIGHELSGEVIEVGSGVNQLKPGDPVTCEEMWWCGVCDPCRGGLPNHCVNLEEMGFTKDGGFAEYMVVPAKYCWKIDRLLDAYRSEDKMYEAGSLVEPTSVAYNAMFVRAGGFKPGAYVVVWGCGPIGLACIALARAAGAGMVVAFEVVSERLELAKKMGADYVFNPRDLEAKSIQPYEKILDVTGGWGADMQIEAAGAPKATLPQMEKCLAINGKIAWIGRADVEAPVWLEYFQVRRSQIFGSQGHSGHWVFPFVIRLMASGKIDMTRIITRRYRLSEGVEALERSTKRIDAKITIKP